MDTLDLKIYLFNKVILYLLVNYSFSSFEWPTGVSVAIHLLWLDNLDDGFIDNSWKFIAILFGRLAYLMIRIVQVYLILG